MGLETFDQESVVSALNEAQSDIDELVKKFREICDEAEAQLSNSLNDSQAALTGDLAIYAREAFDNLVGMEFSSLDNVVKDFIESKLNKVIEDYQNLNTEVQNVMNVG